MPPSNGTGLADRLDAAAKARADTLARFRARPAADDPVVLARRADRRAVADARATRTVERETLRRAEAVRLAAMAEAERQAEVERAAAERAAEAEGALARQGALKVQRDARYLARKAKAQARR